MGAKEILNKLKPVIIIILLFSLVFFIRAQSVNLSSAPDEIKPMLMDDAGVPYFSEMDSYYNYRLTSNYLDHGYIGDVKLNGTNWDLHSYFPPGRSAEYPPLIVYVTAFVYQLANIFGEVPLIVVAYWIPAFIASLAVIPAYLFVRRITNDYGGIAAALIVALAPAYFSHSFAGFFDTDMFNVVLPLFVVWFFTESIRATQLKKKIAYSLGSAIFMILFSMAWEGWWYIFYLIIAGTVIYLLLSKYILKMDTIKPRSDFNGLKEWLLAQPVIFPFIIFIVLSSIVMVLTMGAGFFSVLIQPFGFSQLQESVGTTSYPNVYVSVAELQIPSFSDVVAGVGGIAPFLFGIFGVIYILWKSRAPKITTRKKTKKSRRKRKAKNKKVVEETEETIVAPELTPDDRKNYFFYGIILALWLLITAYAMTKGVRFIETFAIPIAVGAGIFVGLARLYLQDQIKNVNYRTIVMVLLVILAVYSPVTTSYVSANGVLPGTDDSMVSSMDWIKQNTPNNTVIISWWDFGHLFTAKADRPVTFDGGSQNTPRAYWVGKSLFTSDEKLSAAILKMLASSGDQGYLTLENYTKSTAKSVAIIDQILVVDKAAAIQILTTQHGLTAEQAQEVVKYTHPDNPTPVMYITSADMVGKAGWWSYFGSWNFNNNSGQNYLYSMAQAQVQQVNSSTIIQGQNNVVAQINGTQISAGLLVSENNIVPPHRMIFIDNNQVVMDQVVNNESPISIIVIREGNNYITVAMHRELENSVFTRLFFLKGKDMTQFQIAQAQPGVFVWRVT